MKFHLKNQSGYIFTNLLRTNMEFIVYFFKDFIDRYFQVILNYATEIGGNYMVLKATLTEMSIFNVLLNKFAIF